MDFFPNTSRSHNSGRENKLQSSISNKHNFKEKYQEKKTSRDQNKTESKGSKKKKNYESLLQL
jgi:hypothetical protein